MKKISTGFRVICIVFVFLVPKLATAQANRKPDAKAQNDVFEGFRKQGALFSATRKNISSEPGHNDSGTKLLDMACIRQKGNRELPYPIQGHGIITNPPVFTWPMDDYIVPDTFPHIAQPHDLYGFNKYSIQISRSEDFTGKVQAASGLFLPFYHPHKKLEPGRWFWRYMVERENKKQEWSQTYVVQVDSSVPVLESPKASEAFARIPDAHPRVFRFQSSRILTDDQKALVQNYKKAAKNAFTTNISEYTVKGKPIPKNATKGEVAQIERFLNRYEISGICNSIKNLLQSYLFEKNSDYLHKALELGENLLVRNPVKLYQKSDFSGSNAMQALAMLYDIAQENLSKEQRKRYQDFIGAVIPLVISHAMEENVGSADGIINAHFFQISFYDTFVSAIIMKEHIRDAQLWFEMLYDIWLARTPGGGFMDDGLWPNGNVGYVHVNMESMVGNYLLYRDLFDVNLLDYPYYSNCANALAYVLPASSTGDGFGDGAENISNPNPKRAAFAYILGQETNNSFAIDYAYALSGQDRKEPFVFPSDFFSGYRLQHFPKNIESYTGTVPQAAVFPQTGIAVMHTELKDSDNNLYVSFRSSPFGVGSHGHAEQNSFNIIYKGEPIFYPTGYRITTRDKHYLLSQKHSRAKNTITIDGKTQAFGHNGYGWIARYLHGEQISYVLGDASEAYKGLHETSINWKTVLELANSYNAREGFILDPGDDPKVTLFRRHVALLRPNTVVVYDELESDKEVTWTLQLNGRERGNFSLDNEQLRIIADTDNADAAADVFGSSKLAASLSDTNYIKPFDWLNPQRGRPAKTFEKQQYHGKFENQLKTKRMRFLTIIQLDRQNKLQFSATDPDKNGVININGYKIEAELDVSKPARLTVENKKSGAYLLYGPSLDHKASGRRRYSNSTILYEKPRGFQEAVDRYPLMVPRWD
ncbi:MAG: DUF4962 domain-containing protein [Cyclobacteriaceae bacterium]